MANLGSGALDEVLKMSKNHDIIDNKPRETWEFLINQWVHDEMGRKILIEWLLNGHSYERIAEELDISRATVYNKAKRYSAQLFKHCD